MQVLDKKAILVFRIFWQKKFYRNQIGEIHENRKRSLTLVGGGMKGVV